MIDLRCGDCREVMTALPAGCVRICVTSPPYFGLRDYGHAGQIGLEATPDAYVSRMIEVFRAVRRVLADDGTLWLNLGDSYSSTGETGRNDGHGPNRTLGKVQAARKDRRLKTKHGLASKQLLGIPWRVAFALQADGWYLRSDIIWAKPNPMPESVRDRPTKAHEYLFLFSKSGRPTVWNHRDGRWVRRRPAPDYRWLDRLTKRETAVEPEGWREERTEEGERRWRRINLWRACDYYYDADAVREPGAVPAGRKAKFSKLDGRAVAMGRLPSGNEKPGVRWETNGQRNKRSVWTVATHPYKGAHFAVFPPKLIEPCILAGSAVGDTVLDPFCGSGTTGAVAIEHGRQFIGIDLSPAYLDLARERLTLARRRVASTTPLLAGFA